MLFWYKGKSISLDVKSIHHYSTIQLYFICDSALLLPQHHQLLLLHLHLQHQILPVKQMEVKDMYHRGCLNQVDLVVVVVLPQRRLFGQRVLQIGEV